MMEEGSGLKVIAGADAFGAPLKEVLVRHLKQKGIDVEDLGIDKYYTIAEEVGKKLALEKKDDEASGATKGLLVCGTGVGVSIFANKFKGVYAASCTSVNEAQNCRSINNTNVITLGAKVTPPEEGKKILDAWLETPFKAPCPASDGQAWNQDIQQFLDQSLADMDQIPQDALRADANKSEIKSACAICALANNRKFDPVDIMPGGSWNIVREDPTSAVVRFKAGSFEPAHHHTFGHDLIVTEGKKRVWNLTKREVFDLSPGDFLFTPAGDVHRVQYFTDTEFFIRWDGHWDIFLDEDLEAAKAAAQVS
ncbi:hypothetical protein O6H91_12G031600 [Diphasiastrum complanatum]|uniref:Uncharacterized protein n=1 Tax=Diphasiastrum complanatum TaxID=34168 RepID=A0ACC2C0A4_DIPCM|nr:hypothetical protein O6H91_12G031600 [Diphasiastrum complanatum]